MTDNPGHPDDVPVYELRRGEPRPLLCLDFDGVIHGYQSGWQGATVIPDPPVPGAIEFIIEALKHFRVAIFSSRSGEAGGIEMMYSALRRWGLKASLAALIDFPTSKPPAFLTIDDRALTFVGLWPDPAQLLGFKTWQQDNRDWYLTNVMGLPKVTRAEAEAEGAKAATERQPFAWARVHEPHPTPGGCSPMSDYAEEFASTTTRPPGDGWFPLYRE